MQSGDHGSQHGQHDQRSEGSDGSQVRQRTPSRQRGFTYLLLLWLLALAGAGLAVTGERWTTAAQRERERELVFRGEQIRAGIESYRRASPDGSALPADLAALLADRRGSGLRQHLRRRYEDPFTGRADWVELRDASGGLLGVHSRAEVLALGRGPGDRGAPGQRVSSWHFVVAADAASPAAGEAEQYRGGQPFSSTAPGTPDAPPTPPTTPPSRSQSVPGQAPELATNADRP